MSAEDKPEKRSPRSKVKPQLPSAKTGRASPPRTQEHGGQPDQPTGPADTTPAPLARATGAVPCPTADPGTLSGDASAASPKGMINVELLPREKIVPNTYNANELNEEELREHKAEVRRLGQVRRPPKSSLIKHPLKLEPTPQVIFSWSVNADYVARRWEQGTPSPAGRFAAANKMKAAGWPVRIRLDPMVPYEDGAEHWRDGYARAIDRINALSPEMVTIGALRATNRTALEAAARQNGRPTDLFRYLSEKDPSGFKYRLPFEQQVELYRFALDRLDRTRVVPALCKEDVSVWRALGLEFKGCHCLPAGSGVATDLVSSPAFRGVLPAGKSPNKEKLR
jgi:hypothetical protein